MNNEVKSENGYSDNNELKSNSSEVKNVSEDKVSVPSTEERLQKLEDLAEAASNEIAELRKDVDFAKSESEYAINKIYEIRDATYFNQKR